MTTRERGGFEERLRHRIVGLLHAGRLEPGDRLESIRSLAQNSGVDHRVVAEAYRALHAEGLVEIRGSSGVYVSELGRGKGLSSERVRWVSDVLHDGWERGWSRGEVGKLVRRAASRKLRCACIESNEDHMVAFASELASMFDLTVSEVYVDPDAGADQVDDASLEGVDLVATSVFFAEAARKLSIRRPIVVLTINTEYSTLVDSLLRRGRMTAVAVDPEYVRIGRKHLAGTPHEGRVELLLLEEAEVRGIDFADPRVVLTRAARRRLGMEEFHLIAPPPWVISSSSARALLQEVARLTVK